MWQEIIVGIIAIAALLYVGRRLYRMVKRPKGMGCGCGCEGCVGKSQECKPACFDCDNKCENKNMFSKMKSFVGK